jgi:hypothetical protein
VDLSPTSFDQLEYVGARRRSNITNTDDLTNLGDGQPDRLRRADERQARHARRHIVLDIRVYSKLYALSRRMMATMALAQTAAATLVPTAFQAILAGDAALISDLASATATSPSGQGRIRSLADVFDLGRAAWGALMEGQRCDQFEGQS